MHTALQTVKDTIEPEVTIHKVQITVLNTQRLTASACKLAVRPVVEAAASSQVGASCLEAAHRACLEEQTQGAGEVQSREHLGCTQACSVGGHPSVEAWQAEEHP